jgi:hypothetical protein
MKRYPIVATILLATAAGLPGWAQESRLALVVGSNAALTSDVAPLSFADDDAIRTGQVLQALGVTVHVLADVDDDTRRLYPHRSWGVPTRQDVLTSLDRLVNEARESSAQGRTVTLFFVFSGHGSYDAEGRGFLHLNDGQLTHRDLFSRLIAPTAGVCDVVIVLDTCNAEFLLQTRGSAIRRPVGPRTLALEDYDHVGLVLSVSASGEVREWGRALGGVFSHQLRSALMGGADQDCDGRITFPELAAFLDAANRDVTNPSLRLTPYVRPPLGNAGAVLVAPGAARSAARLVLDRPRPLRLTLLDAHLARQSDLNLEGACPREVLLLPGQMGTVLVDEREYALPGSATTVKLSELQHAPSGDGLPRGMDQYYRNNLFKTPYGADFFRSYTSGPWQEGLVVERSFSAPWYHSTWGWVGIGVAAAGATVGSVLMGLAHQAEGDARNSVWSADIHHHNQRVERFNLYSAISWGVSGAALLTGIAGFLLDRPVFTERYVPRLQGSQADGLSVTGMSIEVTY